MSDEESSRPSASAATLDRSRVDSEASAEQRYTEEETNVLEFLRNTKRVDRRWMSHEQLEKLRQVLDGLHNQKNLSLHSISKQVGKSYLKVWGLYRALGIPTRTLAEADKLSAMSRSKHKRHPFDGSEEDRAYAVGFTNGDLTAIQVSGTAVMVSSSTTHPAFVQLFRSLFEKYGHVYQYPMRERDRGYKWKVATRLDNSFRFLLTQPVDAVRTLEGKGSVFWSWLAGLIDSDGNIKVGQSGSRARITVSIGNTDLEMLEAAKAQLARYGYHAGGPYLMHQKGTRTKALGISYTKDMWQICVQGTRESKNLLRMTPLRHDEKVRRKALALEVDQDTEWSSIEMLAREISSSVKRDVGKFKRDAEVVFLEKHRSGN